MEQFPFSSDGFNESLVKMYKNFFMTLVKYLKIKRKRDAKHKDIEEVSEKSQEREKVLL